MQGMDGGGCARHKRCAMLARLPTSQRARPPMSYQTLSYVVGGDGVLLLTLNRPDQLNAFTVEMANELVDAFTRASDDDAVRAIVVTGAGKAFCAGMDLSVGGNVFGLDESQPPTMADRRDGHEAQRGGLVKCVVPPEQLLEEAMKIARRIASERSAVGIALTRQMMYRNSAQPHPLAAHEVDSLAMFYTSIGDGKEGVQAFLEKRPAQFQGKASQMPPFSPWWE